MAALRYILLAAAITLTLALLAHLRLPARAPIPRRTGRRGGNILFFPSSTFLS